MPALSTAVAHCSHCSECCTVLCGVQVVPIVVLLLGIVVYYFKCIKNKGAKGVKTTIASGQASI